MRSINPSSETSPRQTSKQSIERLSASNSLPELRIDPLDSPQPATSDAAHPKKPPKICGAMAQQSGDSGWGNQSAPQKLLHLVGCREPKATPELAKRPSPSKR